MDKKIKKFLYPDWRKSIVFLLVILFFMSLWLQILVNSLPIMIIGTQEFEKTFCDIKMTATNCKLNYTEIQRREAISNQSVGQLNSKYSQFSDLDSNFALAKGFIPASALSCMLDTNVVTLKLNMQEQNASFLEMKSCDSSGVMWLIANLLIVYVVICTVFWFYDNKR